MAHNKLRGRIVEKYGSVKKFSEILGKSQQQTNLKVLGKQGFTREDIVKWSELLDIAEEDCYAFFIA